jgi:hypothetical protein
VLLRAAETVPIVRPEIIAEGLDDVIGRNTEVSRTLFDHRQNGCENTADGSDFLAV